MQQEYLAAFWRLSNARQAGFGPNPILISEIDAYCRFQHVVDPAECADFLYLIQQMDAEYLKVFAERQDKKGK